MDRDRFDRFSSGLGSAATRRSTLGSLAALGLGASMPWSVNAKRKHKHHRKKHHPKPESFCAGKSYCDAIPSVFCGAGTTECGCFVTVGTGEPFCGGVGRTADCSECTPAETCVDISGRLCGGSTLCILPCPNPL
jgi:hypothetical protein